MHPSCQTLGGFEECFGNPVTDPVVRRVGKLGLFHLRRWVPCEGFRLRRCLRTPARAARPASLAVSAPQSACDRPQVKFAASTASFSLFHGRQIRWRRAGEGSGVKRNANAVLNRSAFPETNKGTMHRTAKAATCQASNAFPHLAAKIITQRQIHELSGASAASRAFPTRAGCGRAAV